MSFEKVTVVISTVSGVGTSRVHGILNQAVFGGGGAQLEGSEGNTPMINKVELFLFCPLTLIPYCHRGWGIPLMVLIHSMVYVLVNASKDRTPARLPIDTRFIVREILRWGREPEDPVRSDYEGKTKTFGSKEGWRLD